jgi:hypothetical protein
MTSHIFYRRQRSGEFWFKASPGKQSEDSISKKTHHKKGLVECLKM